MSFLEEFGPKFRIQKFVPHQHSLFSEHPQHSAFDSPQSLLFNDPSAMTWFEALPPLIIITLSLGAMGSLQGFVHRRFNDGKVCRMSLSPP